MLKSICLSEISHSYFDTYLQQDSSIEKSESSIQADEPLVQTSAELKGSEYAEINGTQGNIHIIRILSRVYITLSLTCIKNSQVINNLFM